MTKAQEELQKQIDIWYSYYVSGRILDKYNTDKKEYRLWVLWKYYKRLVKKQKLH